MAPPRARQHLRHSSDLALLDASLDARRPATARRVSFPGCPSHHLLRATRRPSVISAARTPAAWTQVHELPRDAGPVPMKVEAGAHARSECLLAGLNPSSAVADFAPIVRRTYVKAGADYTRRRGRRRGADPVQLRPVHVRRARLWMQTPRRIKPVCSSAELGGGLSPKLQMLSGTPMSGPTSTTPIGLPRGTRNGRGASTGPATPLDGTSRPHR